MNKKLTKSSYDYYGLCKEWRSQKYDKGSTASNRMHYEKLKLYSYDTLLAEIQNDGVVLIDRKCATFSNTSKRHLRELVENLYSNNVQFYIVDDIDNIEYIKNSLNTIKNSIKKYKRARVEHSKYTWKTLIKSKVEDLNKYLIYLKSRKIKIVEQNKQRNEILSYLLKEKIL